MNYARFYTLLNRVPTSDREELKRMLVRQFSDGRTDSVRELRKEEYENLCSALEQNDAAARARAAYREDLRRRRSGVLHQLQVLGVNTACWDTVNAVCKDPRIGGKEFRELDCMELDEVRRRLYAIQRKREGKPVDNTVS